MKFVKIRTWNGSTTPLPPCYPLKMKLYLRYFRVVLFLLQRFKKIWIFRFSFFLWSLSSSIIQCKRVERNHILHWVTSQPSELNELRLTVLTIGSAQAYQFSDFVSSPCRVAGPRLFRQIMTVQKLLFLSLNAIFEHHTLLIFLLVNQLEFHIIFCSVIPSFSFMVVDSNF